MTEHADSAPRIYGTSLALLTDLYQLTMAQGYWMSGSHDKEAVFHLFFRSAPFRGGYAIAAGLAPVVEYLRDFRLDASDLDYLAGLEGNDGAPLFADAFLSYLATLRCTCDVDAVPEGTVVFPQEPLLRIRGPIIEGQLFETALLNLINFQTLIATKAARICGAARGQPVLEFGLRRAQGIDGALAASRAATIGGCAATSNVLAGKLYGIPVKGTHAHSWVMSFDSEREAFEAYARAMPNNCVFLVDTYDTLEGVRSAIHVGQWLREQGKEMLGVRLDSGDLHALSVAARQMLDAAGFPDASIVASNDLDEDAIDTLVRGGAKIGVWGVGTRLVTSHDQAALGGVYKLAAVRRPPGAWHYRVKVSDDPSKTSPPGIQQVRRFHTDQGFVADMIYDEELGYDVGQDMISLSHPGRRQALPLENAGEDLLVPITRQGRLVYDRPTLDAIRARAMRQVEQVAGAMEEAGHAAGYPVGLERKLSAMKDRLIRAARPGQA